MSPHAVDVRLGDLIQRAAKVLAGLAPVAGPYAGLSIIVAGSRNGRAVADLVRRVGVALYIAGKVPANCQFVRLDVACGEVDPGKVRIILLPAQADAGGKVGTGFPQQASEYNQDTPHPNPLPQGERERGGAA